MQDSATICNCGLETTLPLNCELCNTLCCIMCCADGSLILCKLCYQEQHRMQREHEMKYECDVCEKPRTFKGWLNGSELQVSLCEDHIKRCPVRDCVELIRFNSTACRHHTGICSCCRREQRLDLLIQCKSCHTRACSNPERGCSKQLFPLHDLDARYGYVCHKHFSQHGRHAVCNAFRTRGSWTPAAYGPECANLHCNVRCCIDLLCDGIQRKEGIVPYCPQHRRTCDMCNVIGYPVFDKVERFHGYELCPNCCRNANKRMKTLFMVLRRMKLNVPREIRSMLFVALIRVS